MTLLWVIVEIIVAIKFNFRILKFKLHQKAFLMKCQFSRHSEWKKWHLSLKPCFNFLSSIFEIMLLQFNLIDRIWRLWLQVDSRLSYSWWHLCIASTVTEGMVDIGEQRKEKVFRLCPWGSIKAIIVQCKRMFLKFKMNLLNCPLSCIRPVCFTILVLRLVFCVEFLCIWGCQWAELHPGTVPHRMYI